MLVFLDGQNYLLRLERDLRDPAGRKPVRLAVRPDHPRYIETVGNSLKDLAAYLIFHQELLLLPRRTPSLPEKVQRRPE
jgi:hypothetical protein